MILSVSHSRHGYQNGMQYVADTEYTDQKEDMQDTCMYPENIDLRSILSMCNLKIDTHPSA